VHLFEPLELRSLRLRNRIVVSPMCEYSAIEGVVQPWHLVHLGSRAVGGSGLVIAEATAIEARGRISPGDVGLYDEAQLEAWQPVTAFIRSQGAVAGVQLAHAGRKASVAAPWLGGAPLSPAQGGWSPIVAPSALPFTPASAVPESLDEAGIRSIVQGFAAAAQRAFAAGFELVELHAAHGYLLHQFLSPLSNQRNDGYGGSFEHRTRLVMEVVDAVRAVWPEHLPLLIRLSATDWVQGGWDLEQTCALVERLRERGVDLFDISSGGLIADARIPSGPGYQVGFAAAVRARCAVRTSAVGMITAPEQADQIVRSEQADLVMLARELLRDPYWPRRAASALRANIEVPPQYQRAW
jgi:2,4-dienoyl-CoA reductase-like NADH-dependent reductase (Old Yellow Enzyme family)